MSTLKDQAIDHYYILHVYNANLENFMNSGNALAIEEAIFTIKHLNK